jgi:MFS family permease
MVHAAVEPAPSRRPPALAPALAALCVTEIVSWGVLYYAFPVLADSISDDTGWSRTVVAAAFSASQLVAAGVGVAVGRWLDRLGPRLVMTAGSVLAVPAVVAIAAAPGLVVFWLAWLVAGVAMAGVLYQPAFAALTRWYGDRRVSALTTLTLVAGFSSTVFAPLTGVVLGASSWRTTYVVFAVVLAVVTIPLHAAFLRPAWPAPTARTPEHRVEVAVILRTPAFRMLAIAFGLGAFAAFAVVFDTVPLLTGRGLSTELAAFALGLGGVGQVLGRLGYRRLAAATSVRGRTVAILGTEAVAIAVLGVVPGPAGLLVALTLVVGAIRGSFTLLQATAVTDRWGPSHYATLNGVLALPTMAAMALAPAAGAGLAAAVGSYPASFVVLAAVCAGAASVSWYSLPASSVLDPAAVTSSP